MVLQFPDREAIQAYLETNELFKNNKSNEETAVTRMKLAVAETFANYEVSSLEIEALSSIKSKLMVVYYWEEYPMTGSSIDKSALATALFEWVKPKTSSVELNKNSWLESLKSFCRI